MSVIAALYSGISGINSNGAALSVSGDNIANMSTPSFKSASAVFESALTQTIGEAEIGLGTKLAGTSANFTQGAFASSTKNTDLAIQGKGFFIVQNSAGDSFYTRAGIFEQDSSGNLVTSAGGFILQGNKNTSTSSLDTFESTKSAINFTDFATSPATSTSTVTLSANLDASTSANATAIDLSSFSDAEGCTDFSTSTTVYDSLGDAHSVKVYFKKTSTANQWQYFALTLGTELGNLYNSTAGGADGTVVLQAGTLQFTTSGAFSAQAIVSAATFGLSQVTGAIATSNQIGAGMLLNDNATSVAADNTIQWGGLSVTTPVNAMIFDFGQEGGSTAVMTQYSGTSQTTGITQDGKKKGDLSSIEFTKDGYIRGSYTNGTAKNLYQIPLVLFPNEEGLSRQGNNVYSANSNSGDPLEGFPSVGGRGDLRPFQIEQSNVDLATEFVKIITFQRAFQASSRTVTTAAELLQDLVQLGR